MINSKAMLFVQCSVLLVVVGSVSSFLQDYARSPSRVQVQRWGMGEPISRVQRIPSPCTVHMFDKIFEEEGPLGKGITVGKVQVALLAQDRSSSSIFGLLEQAGRSSDDSSEGLADMCHEICMALLRKQSDWMSAASASKWFSANDAGKAESQFNEWSVSEASRFEKEYLPVGGNKSGGGTVVVVSMILEIEGDNTVFEKAGSSVADTQKVLTSIASDVLVDQGQVVNAFEVFWIPGDGEEVLTSRDVVMDFPELVTL